MATAEAAVSLPLDTIIHGDALDVLRSLPDGSVDAVVTDPPYFRVKSEAWDRQWDSATAFLAWMARLRDEWQRVLKPNGSLYVFASPQMAARVEVCLGERFDVLNHIIWRKDTPGGGKSTLAHKESLRSYFPITERIIFAEQPGADTLALGESGYAAQCQRLHSFVFEPLRAYLDGERLRAGISHKQVERATGTFMARHYFGRSQWCLPTTAHYATLRGLFNEQGRRPAPPFTEFHPTGSPFARFHARAELIEYLRADYEYLRADYEERRADYEDLRRPFAVTKDVPYTDVWTFATVAARPGKHPCEKPLDLLRHIIGSSTRPGALVLDCFAGSGSTCEAARLEGRHYLGIERDTVWAAKAQARAALTVATPAIHRKPHAAPIPITRKQERPASRSLWDAVTA